MSNNDDIEPENTPQKLVFDAHRNAAEQRERVSAAPLLPDDVLDTQLAEVEYHAAVMEYFNRLKPHLPDRPMFWDKVPLWNAPLDGERAELADELAEFYGMERYQALGILDMMEENDQFEEVQPREDATVQGLKNLVHWRGRTETTQRTYQDVIDGEVTEEIERPMHLPRDVAMRAHDALEDAAMELGYNVRPGKDIVKTHLDGETGEYQVEGVKSK